MAWFPLFILAIIQGLTEFLPVSSSGHLVLVHEVFGQNGSWQNHLVLDVAVHIGTLFSVLLYFRKDVVTMLNGLKSLACRHTNTDAVRLNLYVVIASIPVVFAGFILHLTQPSWILLLNVMASATIIFGILLWFADRMPDKGKTLKSLNIKDACLIGLAQSLALIPGTSRSGITMTASRFLGYSRYESAHFSLLLAIIAISGAGVIGMGELLHSGNLQLGFDALVAAILAFITGWISIALMMQWIEKIGFAPFAIYRVILGAALLIILNYPTL